MGLRHALLVRTEIRIIDSLFWEQTHLWLIRSAKPQVCLGPWNCNIPDRQQIWQKERDRPRLRSTDSWEAPLPLPPPHSRSGAEAWGGNQSTPPAATGSCWEWHSWLLDSSILQLLWCQAMVQAVRTPTHLSTDLDLVLWATWFCTCASTSKTPHLLLHSAQNLCQVTTTVPGSAH